MDPKQIAKRLDEITFQLAELKKMVTDEVVAMVPPEATRKHAKGLCLYCNEPIEDDEVSFRGTHQRCYKKINRAKNSGYITEDQAIGRGWLLPSDRGGRKFSDDDPITVLMKETTTSKKPVKKSRKK